MKFGEKYELLESLTTGGVETFVANDKVRGERVLVHILECEAQKPNQPTVQWVLEQFRHIAPEPAGLVLETGRYSGTLYAYLVTKMPEDSALKRWVQMYKSQGRDTQEIPGPPAKPTPESESPTAEITHSEIPQDAGSVAPGFGPNSRAAATSQPSKESGQHALNLPNAKPGADRSGIRPAPDWNASPAKIPVPEKIESSNSSPVGSFTLAFNPPKLPSDPAAPAINEGPKPGEFTNFFQGPFRVEGPSATPAVSPQRIEPVQKSVGEFTAMFNSPRSEEPSPAAGNAGNETPGAGFAEWFNSPNIASQTSGTAGAPLSGGLPRQVVDVPSAFPPPAQEPFVPPQPASYVSPAPPIVPVPTPPVFSIPPLPNPVIEKPPAPPAIVSSEGATNAFHRSANEPTRSQPEPSSGPSPYTQVISVRRPVSAAGVQKEAVPDSAAPPFPAASMPTLPPIAPPPLPKPPAMPKLAVPPPPKAPKVGVPEPPVSYWPLILTLTVLFFIAALLVLYFMLKR